MDSVADALLAALRRLAPAKVRAYDSNDDVRDIKVPDRRKRWNQVIETIEARPWVRCELLAKDGSILGYVTNETAAGELDEMPERGGASSNRWFLEMMIKAQTTALTYRDKEHAALLEGMREMMSVQTQTMRELVHLFAVQRDVAADIAAMKAAAENGGDLDQVVKLLDASPKLLQTLGPIVMQFMAKKQQPRIAPANGAKP